MHRTSGSQSVFTRDLYIVGHITRSKRTLINQACVLSGITAVRQNICILHRIYKYMECSFVKIAYRRMIYMDTTSTSIVSSSLKLWLVVDLWWKKATFKSGSSFSFRWSWRALVCAWWAFVFCVWQILGSLLCACASCDI